MTAFLCGVLAFAIATGLTALDLDKTFYIPTTTASRRRLACLWWGFCAANGVLAVVVYLSVRTLEPFVAWPPAGVAAAAGFAYLAVLRVKFSTFPVNGRDVPIGIEAFYDAAREAVFKRINRIAREARQLEATTLAQSKPLQDLKIHAFNSIENDALTSEDEKAESRKWLESVSRADIDAEQRRLMLAIFVLSGRRGSAAEFRAPDVIG